MKKIAAITSTRAEFGLLMPVVKELRIQEKNDICIELIVTGTHLSPDYGYTIEEIENNKLRIDKRIEIPVNSKSATDISTNQAKTLIRFTDLFIQERYSAILILGDRYEMLSVAIAAGNSHTPIFHMCGGDTTEGAVDEWIRHSITKMSYLHFVSNSESHRRVVQMGENPSRVFNYGSTSIDNILHMNHMPVDKALKSLGLEICKYAICTYHPATMGREDVRKQICNFLAAICHFPEIEFIVTKSNADQGGILINELLDKANKKINNLHVVASLGVVRYLSLMKQAQFVLGNSSSGIIEAPAFKIPTINIGDRQRGRLQSKSIINCETDEESIVAAIDLAESDLFSEVCKTVVSPYGDGQAAKKIAKKVIETVLNGKIDLKKKFYDIKVIDTL